VLIQNLLNKKYYTTDNEILYFC